MHIANVTEFKEFVGELRSKVDAEGITLTELGVEALRIRNALVGNESLLNHMEANPEDLGELVELLRAGARIQYSKAATKAASPSKPRRGSSRTSVIPASQLEQLEFSPEALALIEAAKNSAGEDEDDFTL